MSQTSGAASATLLCLASYEKGHRFLQEAKADGCQVHLLTSESLRDRCNFPHDCLDGIHYIADYKLEWNPQQMIETVANLARHNVFDRIVALDDFDLEKAALLREHFRTPGLGESATRLFRDKLAMRKAAVASGIPVPAFTATANYIDITNFVDWVQPPWVLKPRLMAGAIGIKKSSDREEIWRHIHALGNQQSFYLLERFIPGDIFHVDSIWFEGEMVTAIASAYGTPPLQVTQEGGIFTTRLLERDSDLARSLCTLNKKILCAFGLASGVSHTEFIRSSESGSLYFLETSARVGGAHIAELVEFGTGVNLWAEWAKIEGAIARGKCYSPVALRNDYAGLLVSLARQEWPDVSGFTEPELVWRLNKKNHVGFVVRSSEYERVGQLLDEYAERVRRDFHASAPPLEKPHE